LRFKLNYNSFKKNDMKYMLCLLCVFASPARADCFVASEKSAVLLQSGDCHTPQSPCSTFKIPLSLMGYDAGILTDENTPILPFKKSHAAWLPQWQQPHSPALWMQNSTVWYSREVTQRLGAEKFNAYVRSFNYGNRDIRGDAGKNNGLTRSWISSSLTISPLAQLNFVQALSERRLPVSAHAQDMTRRILNMGDLGDGWTLYGKTGSGTQRGEDGRLRNGQQLGWFVGWIEKGERRIVFVNLLLDTTAIDSYAGPRARDDAKQKLKVLTGI
jgi:beta-lactamase class D